MKLSTKSVVSISIALFVTMALFGWIRIQDEREVLTKLLAKQGQSLSHSVAVFSIEILLSEDYPVLDSFLKRLGKDRDDILFIKVSRKGKLVSQYFPSYASQSEPAIFSSDVTFSFSKDAKPQKIGEIQVGLSTEENDRVFASRVRELFFSILITFAVLVTIQIRLIHQIILRPIKELLEGANVIGAGNFDHRINIKSQDEIGELAQAFDQMSENLKNNTTSIDKLHDANQQLGDAVLKAEEMTARAEEEKTTKDKFFSIISHDLRGPIGSLAVIFNDVLKSADDLEEDLFKAAQKTTKNTSQLLNDLLSWAHSQTGHLEVKSTYFELRDPIQDMVEFLEPQAHQKQISLKINLAANISVHADSSMISTAIRNILSNAIKFTPDNGVIEVTLENQKGEAVVSVKDSGKGMKPDIVKRLFKLSEKVTSSPDTANNVGSGLGLILCQEFIQKNNGKIGAESELGKGSKFWFSLPIVEPKAQVSQTITLDMSHLKVLVAEDNPLHRETTANSLSKFSVSYDIAEDGAVAIEKAKAGDYDLIFMDIDMPRLNGFEATRQLQQQPNFKTVIVALSSYEQKDLQGRLEGVTFAAFLQKPLEVGKLTEVLLSHF